MQNINQGATKVIKEQDGIYEESSSNDAPRISAKKILQPSSKEVLRMDAEDKNELERKEAYIEPKTRDLLRKLLQCCEKEEIIPFYSPQLGFVYKVTSKDDPQQEPLSHDFLENLSTIDILSRSFYDSLSVCPNCHSSIITLHNRCPKCKSHHVSKTSLTEHISCGCIDQRENYVDDRCPKCGELLVEGQYRNMGRWYTCLDCNEKFENPEYDVVCRDCKNHFSIKEAQIKEIPKFKLNLNRLKEIRQNVASLEEIKGLLEQLGFTVEMPGFAVGQKSGMQHHFSLIAKKLVGGKEIIIALDHSVSEEEVQTSPLILYIYKISEVTVDIPIFVALPKLNETAKKIAEGHKILLIEGSMDQKQTTDSIKRAVEDKSGTTSQVKANLPEKKRSLFKLRG